MKRMSKKEKVRLADSEKKQHTIIFQNGKAIQIECPEKGKCVISE